MKAFEQIENYDWDDELDDDIEHEETFRYGGQSQPYDSNIGNKMKLINRNNHQICPNNELNYSYHKLSSDEENICISSHDEIQGKVHKAIRYSNGLQEINKKYDNMSNCYHNISNNLLENNKLENKELLTITIEIGNGENENIVVLNTDTPEDVANRFWRKYDMNGGLRDIFIEQIAQNIDQVKKEIKNDKKFWDNYQKEQISTEINSTPPPKSFSKFPLQSFKEETHNIQNKFKSIGYDQHDAIQPNRFINNNSDNCNFDSIERTDASHSYATPGPILINPKNNERKTLSNHIENSRKNKRN